MNLTRDEVVFLLNITRDLYYIRVNRSVNRIDDDGLKKLEPIISKLATKLEELEEVSILCPPSDPYFLRGEKLEVPPCY